MVLAVLAQATPLPTMTAPHLVLVLYSGHALLPANTIFDTSFRGSLGADSSGSVESCSEYLDEIRFPAGLPEREVRSLQAKYAVRPPDVIVAVAPPSLDFCLRQHDQLFPAVPIVFAALGPELASTPEMAPRITGVRSSFDGPATLRLALRLHPRTSQVFIIADPAGADSTTKAMGWPVIPDADFHTTFHRLTGLTLPDLMDRLRTLPDNSLVIDLSMFGTNNGNPNPPQLVAERMAAASRAPIYAAFDPFVGYGFVGAVTTPMDEIGREAAALVGEILAHPNAAALPPVKTLRATPIFDWRQLRRWGIRQKQLPAERIVRFEPPSFWRQHFVLVMSVAGLILLETGLILALVVQSRRRRFAEREAQRRREELAHMTRVATMGELTASLAHEINQPLAAILSNAQAALRLLAAGEAPTSEEMREILADIAADDQRAGEVIRRMRALLRKGESNPMTLDVNDVVHDVVGLVRGEMLLQNVSLGQELALDLPLVHGDRIQLQQALLNLMVNALDAMKDRTGGARRVVVRTAVVDGRSVSVSVEDSGVGVPADKIGQIFEPFVTTKSHGMGLGLAICRSIIQAHGGQLGGRSNPDRGATFWFTLPASEEVRS
jgi:signal transduction histidine kinase